MYISLSHLCNPPGIYTWLLYMKFSYKTNDLIANLATMFLSLREPLVEGLIHKPETEKQTYHTYYTPRTGIGNDVLELDPCTLHCCNPK